MPYSVKIGELTEEKWAEMNNIVQRYVCAQCQKELTIHTNPEAGTMEVGCLNPEHHGWLEKTTAVQEYRRAGQLEAYQPDLGREMNQLALRYPSAIVDRATAALFIIDCRRLGLDPLIQPAEMVPVPFTINRGKPDERKIIQEIVTVDGWLSMAARGCPEKWAGAPSIDPVFDEKVAESLSGDKKAWVYKAAGQFRLDDGTLSPVSTVYGYFTQAEFKKAQYNKTPAADNPGNQAAIRATKRWVRQNFPDCRQRMMELYREWRQRAQGVKEIEEYIDAEYSILDEKESRAKGGKSAAKVAKNVDQIKTKASGGEGKLDAETRKRMEEALAKEQAANLQEEEQSAEKTGMPAAEPEIPYEDEAKLALLEAEPAEQEGFGIDLPWLRDTLKRINWSDNTCKSFLVSKFKVSPQGTLLDVIKRLTRVQAEEFLEDINSRLEKKQATLFE